MSTEATLSIRELADRISATNDAEEALRLSKQLRRRVQQRASEIRVNAAKALSANGQATPTDVPTTASATSQSEA